MPFLYKKSLNANQERVLIEKTLADSTNFTVGDAVKINTDSRLELTGAGNKVAGIIVDMRKADGSPLTDNGAGADYANTYTTPASNTVVAIIDVSKASIYSCPLDAARGTTAGSEDDFTNFDVVAASDVLDESTMAVAGATAQFLVWGTDPDTLAPSYSVLCSIQESQLFI